MFFYFFVIKFVIYNSIMIKFIFKIHSIFLFKIIYFLILFLFLLIKLFFKNSYFRVISKFIFYLCDILRFLKSDILKCPFLADFKKIIFFTRIILRFIFKKALKSIFLFWDIFKSLFSTGKLSNKKFFINQCNLNFRFLINSLYLRVSFCLLLFAPKK